MTLKTGTLYGIGVGPGDPELITLKALKVLQHIPHIFASCSSKNSYSLALSIVRCHLNGAGGAAPGLGEKRPQSARNPGRRQ